jgi:hypothetical protein
MNEKIPIKFHIEDNKLILDDILILLNDDSITIEHFIDDYGVVHFTHMYIERKIVDSIGSKPRGWMELTNTIMDKNAIKKEKI